MSVSTPKPRLAVVLACLSLLAAFACVTVNINFPAAQVEQTADEVVSDVYGQKPGATAPESSPSGSLSVFLAQFIGKSLEAMGPSQAWAADASQADSVSNAAIRGLKNELKSNYGQLQPFYKSGNIGINNQGMLEVRNQDGLNLADVGKMRRLVQSDNATRQKLYAEVAKALNIESSQVGQVQKIFADKWRSEAPGGFWIQSNSGSWQQK